MSLNRSSIGRKMEHNCFSLSDSSAVMSTRASISMQIWLMAVSMSCPIVARQDDSVITSCIKVSESLNDGIRRTL